MLHSVFLLPLCLFPLVVAAAEIGLSDDGREVQLNDDGSWEYVSNDRFATTADGQRVRLKPDGSWEPVSDKPGWVAVPAESVALRRDMQSDGDTRFELLSWRIESARDKRKKNTTLRSQMVLELEVDGTTSGQTPGPGQFTVKDNRGRNYPVEAVSRPAATGEALRLRIIAEGSPRWFGTKFFQLDIAAGAMGNQRAVTLIKTLTDVSEEEVEELTHF